MYNKKLMSIGTVTLLALSMLVWLTPTAAAKAANYLEVQPSSYTGTSVGEMFTVDIFANITGDGGHGMFGYAFKLFWNRTLLNVTSATHNPPSSWGSKWSDIGSGLVWDYNATHGMYETATTALSPSTEVTGTFTLFTLNFQVKYQPAFPEPDGYCLLDLADTAISGAAGYKFVVQEAYDGEYHIAAVAPELPTVYVDPDDVTGKYGETFTVDIKIRDLFAVYDLWGWEFRMSYNTTILDTINVTEGPFLKGFSADTWFIAKFGDEYYPPYSNETFETMGRISAACIFLAPRTSVPYGSGTLATITFNATYETLTYPPPCCDLELYVVKLANSEAEPIGHYVEDGHYCAPFKPLGRVIDAYMCNYPAPYGGQGPNQPSDMFQPQSTVCICANVTYNGNPVQSKDVIFEIRDPQGELISVGTNRTNTFGTAVWCFGLPWPCEDPEETIFGTWTVITTVDIRKVTVNDTLPFKVGWLVNLIEVSTEEDEYSYCEDIVITFKYTTESMQSHAVVFTVVVYDDLGVPIGFDMVVTEFGGVQEWCESITGNTTVTIHVPKWAFVGKGTIYVSALTALPSAGGHAHCPTLIGTVGLVLPD